MPFPLGNSTVVIVVAFSRIQLLSLGVIGEYVGRIYDETLQRPKYIVEPSYGWESVSAAPNAIIAPCLIRRRSGRNDALN